MSHNPNHQTNANQQTNFWDAIWDDPIGAIQSGGSALWDWVTDEDNSTIVDLGIAALTRNSSFFNPQTPKVGYQGGIPSYSAVRARVPHDPSVERRPGSGGRRYFSDTQFVPPEEREAAQLTAEQQAQDLVQGFAGGGLAALPQGRYLRGQGDGMADGIPAMIDGQQPAALSSGEFVIPADVVSAMGNGNSDAGAKALEEMMARVRQQKTGKQNQPKPINPRSMIQ